jgi:hypothetical protein
LTPDAFLHYLSPVTSLRDLTISQLNRIIAIKEKIDVLQGRIDSIIASGGGGEIPIRSAGDATVPAKRKLSAAHRRKLVKALAKARKIRWARIKDEAATDSKPAQKKGSSGIFRCFLYG